MLLPKTICSLCLALAGCSIVEVQPSAAAPGQHIRILTQQGWSQDQNPVVVFAGGATDDKVKVGDDSRTLHAVVPMDAQSGPISVKATSGPHLLGEDGTKVFPVVMGTIDFTVLSENYREREPNDQWTDVDDPAQAVPAGARIRGVLTEGFDIDWYFLDSGPEGAWGYTLQVNLRPPTPSAWNLNEPIPVGCFGHVELETGLRPFNLFDDYSPYIGFLEGWLTVVDGEKVFLAVSRDTKGKSGPNNEGDLPYEIRIARTPLDDALEPNNTPAKAKRLPRPDERVYLAPAFRPGKKIAISNSDWYKLHDLPASRTLRLGFSDPFVFHEYGPVLELYSTPAEPSEEEPLLLQFSASFASDGFDSEGYEESYGFLPGDFLRSYEIDPDARGPWFLRVACFPGDDLTYLHDDGKTSFEIPWYGRGLEWRGYTRRPYSLVISIDRVPSPDPEDRTKGEPMIMIHPAPPAEESDS